MTIEEYIASLNLSDEAKKKATEGLKNFLKDNYVEKAKFDEATTAKSNLETQIKERDKQLETLKKTAGDKEKLESTIQQLQEENKSSKTKYEQDLKNLRIDSAVKLKLTNTAQDVDIVASLIDKTKLNDNLIRFFLKLPTNFFLSILYFTIGSKHFLIIYYPLCYEVYLFILRFP